MKHNGNRYSNKYKNTMIHDIPTVQVRDVRNMVQHANLREKSKVDRFITDIWK